MLSTLAIISIFTEIFTGGILFSGALTFLKKFFSQKQRKDLAISLVFFAFTIFIAVTIVSQLLYNLGKPVASLMMLQKIIACDLLFGSLFVLFFIKSKFKMPGLTTILWVYGVSVFYLSYRVIVSTVDLIYRPGVLEPVVNFSLATPVKSLWILSWLLLFIVSSVFFFRQKGNVKALVFYDAFSALLIFSSYISTIFYTGTQNSYFLLLSWGLTLLGTILLTLGEIIPPESDLARNPFNFFRSRILFKLIFIFVLLIVILFEVTTLATLTLSKQALKSSIFSTYRETAQNISQQVQSSSSLDIASALKIVKERKIGRSGVIYIVDKSGNLVVHPDQAYVSSHKNLKDFEPVANALKGMSGVGEFPPDEFGEVKVGAYYPLTKIGGAVIVEEPLSDAYLEMRRLETNSLLFVIAGILLTVLTGLFLAQSIESPIHKLIVGTQAVSKGDLGYRIDVDSIDEMGLLAGAFNRMTHDLRDSQERLILSEKLASLGTMAAGMAHEIKNPLVSLRTFSQLLQQKWDDKEFRDKFSQIVPTEIERINKIAESLLKFGRPSKPEMSRVNINNILEEILLLFESECRKNGVRVTTKFAEIPEITGDTQQISQAMVNILLNGIQAMEKGGELIVKTDVGEVIHLGKGNEGIAKEDGSVVWGEEETKQQPTKVIFIEVTDSGQGIAAENLKSLFDPFFTTKVKGTGMGLPITLRIIEDHGGSIKVKSEVGKGTTFLITLPQSS